MVGTALAIKLQDLRRTARTKMASLGIPRLTVSRVLNHTEGGVTSFHDSYRIKQKRKAGLLGATKTENDAEGGSLSDMRGSEIADA